jgi:ribosomal protein L40E
MKDSSIQWTDHTFNAWEGCTKVAPECKNCYAETLVDKRFGRAKWGKGQPRRRTSENLWKQPLAWNKTAICLNCGYAELIGSDDCRKCGVNFLKQNRRRPRVFCLSLGDWLDEEVPIEWLAIS